MKTHKNLRASQPQTPEEILREQIREAFDVIPHRGALPSSYEMPANAIVVETFAETCYVLGLMSCGDGKDLLAELMIESLTLENNDDFRDGIRDIFYFLRICPPNAEPNFSYTDAQFNCIQNWLLRLYEHEDLQLYEWDIEEIFDSWKIDVVRHKTHWE